MTRRVAFALFVCTAMLFLPAARAEDAPKITGLGIARVPLKPTALRLEIQLRTFGKTPEPALARLEQRKNAAVSKLKKIAPGFTGLKFSRPAVGIVGQRSPEPSLVLGPGAPPAAPPAGGAAPSDAKPTPRLLEATTVLSAEWPLASAPAEQIVAAAEAIKDKVQTADVAGLTRPQKLTPEEQEALEDLNAASHDPDAEEPRDHSSQPGVPRFLYVAAISDADRKDAMAQAFAVATRDAADLAQATGTRLGTMASAVRTAAAARTAPETDPDAYRGPSQTDAPRQSEITAAGADDLTLAVQIEATFKVLPADK